MAGAPLIPPPLAGVSRLALDTAPLIYLIEQHPQFAAPVLEVARRLDDGEIDAVASTLTLTEVLTRPLRLGRTDLVRAYRELLEGHEHLRLIPVDEAVAVTAAELRARHGIRTPDAIQVAAAVRSGCDVLLTNDRDLKRVTEVRVVLVGELIDP